MNTTVTKTITIGESVMDEIRHFLEVMGESSFHDNKDAPEAGSMAEHYGFTYPEFVVLRDKIFDAKVGRYVRLPFTFKEAVLMYGELDNRFDIETSNSFERGDEEDKMAARLKIVMQRFVEAFGKEVTAKRCAV